MGIHKNSVAHKVRAFLKLNPKAEPAMVAKELGVKTHHVHSTVWRDRVFGAPKRTYKKQAKNTWKTVAIASSNTPINPPPPPPPAPVPAPEKDTVNSPEHYRVGGIEVIDYIKAKLTPEEFRGYLKGNVLKYSGRAGHKDDLEEDLCKMLWYTERLLNTYAKTHTT